MGKVSTALPNRSAFDVRRTTGAISVLALALGACPVQAQDTQAPPSLEDLIPDSAVSDAEAWANGGVPVPAQTPDGEPALEADSPLADLPQLTVPWPDDTELPQLAPLETDETIQFVELEDDAPAVVADGDVDRISDELALVFPSDQSLFPIRAEFLDRFADLSRIRELSSKDDNIALLTARARVDEETINRLLRIYGYYDANITRSVGVVAEGAPADAARPSVQFSIVPGKRYAFGAVELGRLADAGADYPLLRGTFEIKSGDPISSDRIVEERYDLDEALGENGYPFAKIEEPELAVDHARFEGDLTMPVTPAGKYNFGQVISNLPNFLSSEHLADIARFAPGDIYQRSLELDLRRAILATGLVSSVTLTPRPVAAPSSGAPGTVAIDVAMTKGPLRTISGALGYGTGEGLRAEAAWEHRNLFPDEGLLRVRGIAGTREQLAGVTFRKNNFGGRDRVLTIDAFATTVNREGYEGRTVSVISTYERLSTLLYQKPFGWSVGLEAVATQERESTADGTLGPRQTYFVGAAPVYGLWDTSDDLLDPTNGFRAGLRVSPEVSRTNGAQSFYVRMQADASYYRRVAAKVIIAGRARVGTIPGTEIANIAPSRRYYAGGGGSVRGYGYQAIGPQSDLGDPTGGRSLTELSVEARIGTGIFDGALQVVPFVDAGAVGPDATPSFSNIKVGVGVGIRYLTSFGPIRVDVGTPLNPGPNDSRVAVYVALGQAF